MAAIVAQITKANWERKKKRLKYIPIDKSVYQIPPFDDKFEPNKHNIFLKRKQDYVQRHEQERQAELVRSLALELKEEKKRALKASEPISLRIKKACFGLLVLAFPSAILFFLFFTFFFI